MHSLLGSRSPSATDSELLEVYHHALREYETSSLGSSQRVRAFAQLASAEAALASRFGAAYLQRCRGTYGALGTG